MAFFVSRWNRRRILSGEVDIFPHPVTTYLKETFFSLNGGKDYKGWGWKEPISWYYLEFLSREFQNMKYIHVLRNGLDMAFSNNDLQFRIWGKIFDIQPPKDSRLLSKAKLRYWLKANQKALNMAKKHLTDSFLIVKYENLCHEPAKEIERIGNFLEVKITQEQALKLSQLVEPPASINRYQDNDCTIFERPELNQVQDLGYTHEIS